MHSLFSAKELKDVNGNRYEFSVCETVSGQQPDVGMVVTKPGEKPVVLGRNNRALVSSQGTSGHSLALVNVLGSLSNTSYLK